MLAKITEMNLQNDFVKTIRQLEERLFPDLLDPEDKMRMKSPGYSWEYRPSHHAETRLITAEDVEDLKKGKRMLSVGGHPGTLERVLRELGVPEEAMLLADVDPRVQEHGGIVFDMTNPWPDIGMFDLILFPESLCIALADRIKKEGTPVSDAKFPTDAREAELLTVVLGEAFAHLKPGGEIRANGPQSHPNVVKAASEELDEQWIPHVIDYQRYFLRVR